MKLPTCSGEWDNCGEFDCFADPAISCEDCLCNYRETGGMRDPGTGKRVNRLLAYMRYGKRGPGEPKKGGK